MTDNRDRRRHLVIYSSGRSGSNRLLDIFDQHRATNCRNEIFTVDPVFAKLAARFSDDPRRDMVANWQTAVRRAALRKGSRDRFDLRHKAYLRPGAALVRPELARRKPLRRHLLGVRTADWPIPRWVLRPDAEWTILPAFKLTGAAGLICATHARAGSQILVHNLRDPASYLASWYNRFVLKPGSGSPEDIYRTVRSKAAPVIARYGAPMRLPEEFSMRALLTAELWMWPANNEPLIEVLDGSPAYRIVTYGEVSRRPVETARELYDHAGLDFSGADGARIAGLRNRLFPQPHTRSLDPGVVSEVVEDVLADGPLARALAERGEATIPARTDADLRDGEDAGPVRRRSAGGG